VKADIYQNVKAALGVGREGKAVERCILVFQKERALNEKLKNSKDRSIQCGSGRRCLS
jgi:hypothetical protein